MKYTLTDQEIANLFTFCEKHHVHQYDVQLELVDHLANAIEEKLDMDPTLNFDAALSAIHADFGIKGFAGIVNAKQQSMEMFCRKQRWDLLRSYFTFPKVAMTICLLIGLIFAKRFITITEQKIIFDIAGFCLMATELAIVGWSAYLFRKQKKKLLIADTIKNTGYVSSFCIFNFLVLTINKPSDFSYYYTGVVSILFLIYILAYRDFMIKLNQMVRKEYPQVFA